MPRSKSSQRWLARQAKDPYARRARQEGARSRSTYKLEELDRRDHILRPGITVVDLGAAPGGWSRYAKSRVGDAGRVVALDILPMEPIVGVEFIQGDFNETPVLESLIRTLQAKIGSKASVDLVISDMAPNTTGVASVDQARSIGLAELAFDFADQMLKPGGSMVIKVFQGAGFNELHARMRRRFETLHSRKPAASRAESREIYLLGKGFKDARV